VSDKLVSPKPFLEAIDKSIEALMSDLEGCEDARSLYYTAKSGCESLRKMVQDLMRLPPHFSCPICTADMQCVRNDLQYRAYECKKCPTIMEEKMEGSKIVYRNITTKYPHIKKRTLDEGKE
jgi:hypothetical protein